MLDSKGRKECVRLIGKSSLKEVPKSLSLWDVRVLIRLTPLDSWAPKRPLLGSLRAHFVMDRRSRRIRAVPARGRALLSTPDFPRAGIGWPSEAAWRGGVRRAPTLIRLAFSPFFAVPATHLMAAVPCASFPLWACAFHPLGSTAFVGLISSRAATPPWAQAVSWAGTWDQH
ncbi:hypothetical protein Nepgr_001265 [Nepenthes gracilis]|uniref:Uncharacterized protein n=1 Tax=Nepenthes gracilis TaxID=150966 RepID=A0AAD3P438_NEPGR|nr:hypothetical protein Nepgr_001265 [Nepenthes gracilis]